MKLADIRETYYDRSRRVSEIVRQLALAGVAVIWLFKVDVGGRPSVPRLLVFAGVVIVLGLACDLLQYAWSTQVWLKFFNEKEAEVEADRNASPPRHYDPEERDWPLPPTINRMPLFFFWAKLLLVLFGYLMIVVFLVRHLRYT